MRYIIVSLLVITLLGCSPVSQLPLSTYTIEPKVVAYAAGRHQVTSKTLLLNTMLASPGYDTAKMLYVNIPFKLKAYANNAWAAPPASMLESLLINSFRQMHYFSAVMTSPFSGRSNYVVSAKLLTLQQEFLHPVSEERMVVAVNVISTKDNSVVGERVFQSIVPAPENNPYGGVLAANKAAQSIASQVARYVVKVAS